VDFSSGVWCVVGEGGMSNSVIVLNMASSVESLMQQGIDVPMCYWKLGFVWRSRVVASSNEFPSCVYCYQRRGQSHAHPIPRRLTRMPRSGKTGCIEGVALS